MSLNECFASGDPGVLEVSWDFGARWGTLGSLAAIRTGVTSVLRRQNWRSEKDKGFNTQQKRVNRYSAWRAWGFPRGRLSWSSSGLIGRSAPLCA